VAGLSPLVALALAAWLQADRGNMICGLSFTIADGRGMAEQATHPDGSPTGIRFVIFADNGPRVEWWNADAGVGGIGPPSFLAYGFDLPPSGGRLALWARYWAEGEYLGQVLHGDATVIRLQGSDPHHRHSLRDPAILARLMQNGNWEQEIVDQDGTSLLRRPMPFPDSASVRAALAGQSARMAEAMATMASPSCGLAAEAE